MSSLGRTISGGANVMRGYEAGVQRQRVAREQQLMLEELNRIDRERQLDRQAPAVGDVRMVTPSDYRDVVDVPLPTAPVAPAPAAPTTTGGGRGDILPPLAGQPQPTYPPEGVPLHRPYQDLRGYTPPANLSGPEQLRQLHEERLRRLSDPQRTRQEDAAVRPYLGVKQPEPFDARTGFSAEPTVTTPAAAPAAPSKPTKAAQQYDNRKTPYDDLMNEAAQQYGLDPVMFKRLIGTESSFNPKAESPRGAQFGLGIAQIHSVHRMSDADRLNPQVAIPFAAQLFSQYLREAGGDYSEALMRYKGASSTQGRASMQGPIDTILSGTSVASPTAPATTPSPVEAVAEQTRKDPADFYLADRAAVSRDMQVALRKREELVRMANVYQQAGRGSQYVQIRNQIMEMDDNLFYLQGIQGLQELTALNDPRRLSAVWSEALGTPVQVIPRTDGAFNVTAGGRTLREGIDASTVSDLARSSFDVAFRQQKGEASAAMSMKQFESDLKIREGNAAEVTRMIRETTVEGVKGNNSLTLEWAKANLGWDIRPTGAGDGTVIIRPPNAPPYLFNATGNSITMDGVRIPANSARLIGGLPQATQARLNQVR